MFTKNFYKWLSVTFVNTSQILTQQIVDTNGNIRDFCFKNQSTIGTSASASGIFDNVNNYASASTDVGVRFGTGTTPPTLNDTRMESLVPTNSFTVTVVKSDVTASEEYYEMKFIYTLISKSSSDITITEIGAVGLCYRTTTNSTYYPVLLERSLLPDPVTIPAGGVGQVTYTIRFNFPTA